MSDDDEAARSERARRLREEIERVKGNRPPEDDAAGPPSPQEFVERRMRELAERDERERSEPGGPERDA